MTSMEDDAHERAILDPFSRQATGFADAGELHADEMVALVVDAAGPSPKDTAIDLAFGPGTVACALAKRAKRVVELDATEPMLDKVVELARSQGVKNVEGRVQSPIHGETEH